MRSFFLVLLLAASGLAAWAPSSAFAQRGQRVVVERFRGPRAAHARSLLVRDLTDAGYVVVSDDELDGARRELGLGRELDESDYVALARTLHAAAFIDGRVGHAHRTWRLVCRVRNGADGSVLGSEGWGGRTQGAIDAVGRTGASQLREHLARAAEPAAPQPVATETPWYAGGEDAESATDAEGEGHFGEEEPVAEQPASTRYDSVRIAFSGGSLWRQMQAHAQVYAVRRGITAADPSTALIDEARGYTSSGIGHAELGAEAEFFPGALGDQPFPYLGLIASFRHSVLLSSSGCRRTSPDCTGDGRISVGTDQMDVQAGLRFRYRLGADRRDVQLFGDVSYGYSTFTFDLNALQQLDYQAILPPLEYQWVGISAGFDYGLVPDALFLQIRGGYRIGVGLGTSARNVWGIESSSQGGWNMSAELKHEANWLAQGVFVSLRFEFFQFMTSFRGQVGCATPGTCPDMPNTPWLDNSLWEPWPAQAGMPAHLIGGIRDTVPDNYFRWALYIGYAFR